MTLTTSLYVQFSDDLQHIRKWSREPFDGAIHYEAKRFPPEVWTKHSNVG